MHANKQVEMFKLALRLVPHDCKMETQECEHVIITRGKLATGNIHKRPERKAVHCITHSLSLTSLKQTNKPTLK